MATITVHAYDHGAATTAPLPNVWVYWKVGSTVITLRTDATGLLHGFSGGDATMSWLYTTAFATTKGTAASAAFTRGAKPIPHRFLLPEHFTNVVVGDPWPSPYTAPEDTYLERWTPIGCQSAVGSFFSYDILLPNHQTSLTSPTELSLWPLLFEHIGHTPTADAYYTEDLPQGNALLHRVDGWWQIDPAVNEWGPAGPPPVAQLPWERALQVNGQAESRAAEMDVRFVDETGTLIPFADAIEVVRDVASGAITGFSTILYLDDAASNFGDIQILVSSRNCTPAFIDAYSVALVGAQPGLRAEDQPDAQTEVRVVDFASSPRPTELAMRNWARMRRMANYAITIADRPFSAALPTVVETPQMPLWMAELQLLGYNANRLSHLMQFRQKLLPGAPAKLAIACHWNLNLSWSGPCYEDLLPRSFRSTNTFTSANPITYTLSLNAAKEVQAALSPVPARIPFPVANRPLPTARLEGEQRTWGSGPAAPELDALIFEWQPLIADAAGNEIIRGGDGMLTLDSLQFDGVAAPLGLNWDDASDTNTAPRSFPVLRLNTFRVSGRNPERPVPPARGFAPRLRTLVDLAVQEYYDANVAEPRVSALPLAMWQVTIRNLLSHESAALHFGTLGGVITTGTNTASQTRYYGKADGMPLFGYPHGYGIGQLDNPAVQPEECWSFKENIRGAVRLVMNNKATEALDLFGAVQDTDLARARFQRECVRRYNGWAPEFVLHNGQWRIRPNIPANRRPAGTAEAPVFDSRVVYPNDILDTDVVYYIGDGLNAADYVFVNNPIAFTEDDYGPVA